MISGQAELEHKLRQIAELQALLTDRRAKLNGRPDAIAFTGSFEAILRELFEEVQEYLDVVGDHADYEFHFTGKKAAQHAVRLTEFEALFKEFQTLTWLGAERVLNLGARFSGSPIRRVSENCTLTVAYARRGSLQLGLSYIVESMFPETELQDNTAAFLEEATQISAAEDFQAAQRQRLDPQFLNHLATLGRLTDNLFTGSKTSYRGHSTELRIDKTVAVHAENMVSMYKQSQAFEDSVHVGKLNFYSGKYEVSIEGRIIPLFYESGVIDRDLAERAANKHLRIKGILYKDSNGRPERLVASSAELVESG